MNKTIRKLTLTTFFVFLPLGFVTAGNHLLYPGFTPLKESKAFADFLKGPKSSYAKLIFLIDRFAGADIRIIYNGYEFDAPFAAGIAKWFLTVYYKGQQPKAWIYQWCNRSTPKDELIRVKLPDQSYRLSREILLNELEELERALKESCCPERSDCCSGM